MNSIIQVLDLRRKAFGECHLEVAAAHDLLARFCFDHSRYVPAEDHLKKSLEIKRKLLDAGHPSVSKTYDQMAQVYRKRGQYERAEHLFRKYVMSLNR